MGRAFLASAVMHVGLAVLLVALTALGRELPVEGPPITVEILAEDAAPAPSPLPPQAPPAAAAPQPPRQAAAPAPPPPPAPKVERAPEPEPPPPPPPPPPVAESRPKPPKEPEAPEPAPEPKKAEAPAPKPPKPAPAKPKPEKVAEPPKPRPEKPAEVAKAPPKPERSPPPTPPAPKQAENDFDALLRSVERTPKRVQAAERREGKGDAAAAVGGTLQPGAAQVAQINPSVLAASISRQITPCWNIPVAAQGIGGLRVELNIAMGPDGGIRSVVPVDAARMGRDPVFQAFAESAVRAVRACSPLKLPPESYQVWRNIIFNFDPSRMTG
jgi:outer membrane biosynthesis protein TonB